MLMRPIFLTWHQFGLKVNTRRLKTEDGKFRLKQFLKTK